MTLTVKHDLLTDLLFSMLGKRTTQTPVQAIASSITSDTNLRKRLTKAMDSESFADIAWIAHEFNDSGEPILEEVMDRVSENFQLYEILETDPTHYATSFGSWLVKGILLGFKDSFTDCEKANPMYLLIDYLDSIVGYVSDSSSQSEYEFRGRKYTDNLFNYIVALAEYRHFLYGGELDELVDTSFISLWVPEKGRN